MSMGDVKLFFGLRHKNAAVRLPTPVQIEVSMGQDALNAPVPVF